MIECLVVIAGFQIHRYRQAQRRIVFPVSVLVVAFVVQMGAQVSGAPRTLAGWLFAAVPALGCLVVLKLAATRSSEAPSATLIASAETGSTVVDLASVRDERIVNGAHVEDSSVLSWPPR